MKSNFEKIFLPIQISLIRITETIEKRNRINTFYINKTKTRQSTFQLHREHLFYDEYHSM